MIATLLSTITSQDFLFFLIPTTFASIVLNGIRQTFSLKSDNLEICDINISLQFIKNEIQNFKKKTDVFNHFKEQNNKDIGLKICFYLIQKDSKNKIFDDNIKQEDIEHTISSLEQEKEKYLNRFYSDPSDIENIYVKPLIHFICFSYVLKFSAKELNEFLQNYLNEPSSIKNLWQFPFLSAISYSLFFTNLSANILSLLLFVHNKIIKFAANKLENKVVLNYLKKVK